MYIIRVVATIIALATLNSTAFAGIDDTYKKNGPGWGVEVFKRIFGLADFGKTYAVVIGIEKYSKFRALEGPASDAIKVSNFLKNEALFDYVITLTDEKATKDRINSIMDNEIPGLIRPGDRFFLLLWPRNDQAAR